MLLHSISNHIVDQDYNNDQNDCQFVVQIIVDIENNIGC